MVSVRAVAPNLQKGSVWRPPAARFDLEGMKEAVEEAVCRAWRQEMARQKKGDTAMEGGAVQELRLAEGRSRQASDATNAAPVASRASTGLDVCQEVLGRILAAVENRAIAAYQAAVSEAEAVAKERGEVQARMAHVEAALATAASEAQEREEADEKALQQARARAQEALAPYVAAGVVTPREAEEHLEGAFRQMGEQVQAQRQEARARLGALRAEIDQLQAREVELEARREALETRLAQLRSLPCIAAVERARQEKEARRKEAAQAAIRFLETAPWHELSWQKRLTPRMKEAVALAGEDPLVFDALVERLGRELERVDPAVRPGIGWSVVRAIEALEMERLFPDLVAKRAELVQAVRRYQRERQAQPALADKVICLASRWGARLAAR